MPPWPKPVSKAQNAAMHAAAEGHSTLGIPQSVGKEFAKGAHNKDLSSLPKRVGSPKGSKSMKAPARKPFGSFAP